MVKAISKQLKEKSFRTKERCFELLRELVLVLDGGLQAYLAGFAPDIEKSIEKGAKTSLKVEALLLLSLILEKHHGADFSLYIKKLGPSVLQCVADSNYKISSVALKVRLRESPARTLFSTADSVVVRCCESSFRRLSRTVDRLFLGMGRTDAYYLDAQACHRTMFHDSSVHQQRNPELVHNVVFDAQNCNCTILTEYLDFIRMARCTRVHRVVIEQIFLVSMHILNPMPKSSTRSADNSMTCSQCLTAEFSVIWQVCGKLTSASKDWTAGDPFIANMYTATFGRLNSQDQDLEVSGSGVMTCLHL